jgi:hypothetical protein
VIPGARSFARLIGSPRSKLAIAMNLAARLWIREERVKSDGLFEIRVIHHELVDHEFIERLSRVFPQDHNQRVIGIDFVDHDRILFCEAFIGSMGQGWAS